MDVNILFRVVKSFQQKANFRTRSLTCFKIFSTLPHSKIAETHNTTFSNHKALFSLGAEMEDGLLIVQTRGDPLNGVLYVALTLGVCLRKQGFPTWVTSPH